MNVENKEGRMPTSGSDETQSVKVDERALQLHDFREDENFADLINDLHVAITNWKPGGTTQPYVAAMQKMNRYIHERMKEYARAALAQQATTASAAGYEYRLPWCGEWLGWSPLPVQNDAEAEAYVKPRAGEWRRTNTPSRDAAYNRAKFSRSVNREDFDAGWDAALARAPLSAQGDDVLGRQRWSKEAEMMESWLAAPAQADDARVLYTCIGKGGTYELIGRAFPAGALSSTLMVSNYPVYRDTASGKLFVRTAGDFDRRMQRIDSAPAPAAEEVRIEPWEDRLRREVTPAVFDVMSEGYRVSQGAEHIHAELQERRAAMSASQGKTKEAK